MRVRGLRIAAVIAGILLLGWGVVWGLAMMEHADEARRQRTWAEGGCAILTEVSAYAMERGGRFYCPPIKAGPAVRLSPHSRQ